MRPRGNSAVNMRKIKQDIVTLGYKDIKLKQICPGCGELIGALAGSRDAICKSCGFKDPCCE